MGRSAKNGGFNGKSHGKTIKMEVYTGKIMGKSAINGGFNGKIMEKTMGKSAIAGKILEVLLNGVSTAPG